jgi:hypothetical protein
MARLLDIFKAQHGKAPRYLQELITPKHSMARLLDIFKN